MNSSESESSRFATRGGLHNAADAAMYWKQRAEKLEGYLADLYHAAKPFLVDGVDGYAHLCAAEELLAEYDIERMRQGFGAALAMTEQAVSSAESETASTTDELMREVQALFASVDWHDRDAADNAQHRALCMVEQHARRIENAVSKTTALSAGACTTPRTDAFENDWFAMLEYKRTATEVFKFARQLERELVETQRIAIERGNDLIKRNAELAEAREALAIAERIYQAIERKSA